MMTAQRTDEAEQVEESPAGPTLERILLMLLESATIQGVKDICLSAESSAIQDFALKHCQGLGVLIDMVAIEQRELGRKLS